MSQWIWRNFISDVNCLIIIFHPGSTFVSSQLNQTVRNCAHVHLRILIEKLPRSLVTVIILVHPVAIVEYSWGLFRVPSSICNQLENDRKADEWIALVFTGWFSTPANRFLQDGLSRVSFPSNRLGARRSLSFHFCATSPSRVPRHRRATR